MQETWVQTNLREADAATRWQEAKLAYTNRLYQFNFAMERLAEMVEK